MRTRALLTSLCALAACASIRGTQTFEATQQFTLPNIGAVAAGAGSQTIAAVGAQGELSFAESVLDDVDELRERDHIDSAEATVRVVSIRLSTDTTFAGVTRVRVQLVAADGPIELCNHTLSIDEQNASSITCEADHIMDEAALQQTTASAAPAQIGAQLDVSGGVTATTLSSVVTFEVGVRVDASL